MQRKNAKPSLPPPWNLSPLGALYTHVLEDLVQDKPQNLKILRFILGTIVTLAEPRSARALTALLNMEPYIISNWLVNLRAVIYVPPDEALPVEIIHKSFCDFLLRKGPPSGDPSDRFRVHESNMHHLLARTCLNLMMSKRGLTGL